MRRVMAACAAVVFAVPAQLATASLTREAAAAPSTTISGTVTDTAGHPLHDATVGAYRNFRFISTHTSADGRFTLHVPAGHYDVDVDGHKATGGASDATGYGFIQHTVTVAAGGHRNSGTFALPIAGALRGVVTDADGHPLRNVVVSWVPPEAYLSSDFGPFFAISYDTPKARTDASGTYTFKGMSPDAVIPCFDPSHASGGDHDSVGYRVRCAPSSAAPARGKIATVPTVALTSAHGATLRGTVTDRAGRPAPDATIELRKLGSSYQDFAYTDRQGRFVVTSEPAGRYRVCGESTSPRAGLGLLRTCRTVTLAAEHSAHAVVRLRPGGAVSGRIIGPSGRGVPRLQVTLRQVPKGNAFGEGPTNPSGHFTVGGLPTSNYKVCWEPNQSVAPGDPTGIRTGCLAHTVHVVVGRIRQGVHARLARGGAIAGQVSGIGHHRTFIIVDNERENIGLTAIADQHGRFRVTDLTPGIPYRVCAESVDLLYNDRTVCSRKRVTPTAGGTIRGVDLHFPALTRLRVTVTDTAGHRLSGVEVAALQACRGQWCPRHPVFGSRGVIVNGVNMTNRRGIGTIAPRHGGRFAVCALAYYAATPTGNSPTGYGDKCTGSTFSITAARGAVTAVHIVLAAGAVVTGQVVNAHGNPIPNAQVHLPGSPVDDLSTETWPYYTDGYNSGPDTDSLTDANGRYTIHSVRPGQAKLCARNAKGYQDGCLTNDLTLTGGAVTTAPDLQLTAGASGNRTTMRSTEPNNNRPVTRLTIIDGHVVVRPTHS